MKAKNGMHLIYFFLIMIVFDASTAFAQNKQSKPIIDFEAVKNWAAQVGKIKLSDNGRYYSVNDNSTGHTLITVSDTGKLWQKILPVNEISFSADSRQAVFLSADSLCFLELGSDKQQVIANVRSFKLAEASNSKEWLLYSLKTPVNELVLNNRQTGKEQHFESVTSYQVDNVANTVILKTAAGLDWVNLSDGSKKNIWSAENGNTVSKIQFDHSGKQLAFVVEHKKGAETENEIWYYAVDMEKAVPRVTMSSPGIDTSFRIRNDPEFSANDKWLFFSLQQRLPVLPHPESGAVMVDVWGYRDIHVQTEKIEAEAPSSFKVAVLVSGGKLIRIEAVNNRLVSHIDDVTGNYIVVSSTVPVPAFHSQFFFYYLMSLEDGSRRLFHKGAYSNSYYSSPSGVWLVWFDSNLGYYFSCDLRTGKIRNICTTKLNNFASDAVGQNHATGPLAKVYTPVEPIAGWLSDDKGLLVYDKYDLWKLDPTGTKVPVNMTQGYGIKHKIELRIVYNKKQYDPGDSILLTAYSTTNKYNGFYQFGLSSSQAPKRLTLEPCIYFDPRRHLTALTPIKAKSANVWVVRKETVSDAPNYFITNDLVTYRRLTNIQLHLSYNWLTTQLIDFKELDGHPGQGILYKPENFDPTKKYPVIFFYYEKMSQRMYEYLEPEITMNDINIPWFVSHSYLVFACDINYWNTHTSGKYVGEWVVNSVVGAAQYLAKLPYVDAAHMGIQGHSFGGGETKYLTTHNKIFAAASSMAGDWDNEISHYLRWEGTRGKMGNFTMWENPGLYIKYSNVFAANTTTTPILIVHDKKDWAHDWKQSLQLFMALRMNDKKAWMLQYDNGEHSVSGKDAEDYTIRMEQFFDHYLKEKPAPKWMTLGVPASLKGIETRYDLDSAGNCGKDCKVCKKINTIYNKAHSINASVANKAITNNKGELKEN